MSTVDRSRPTSPPLVAGERLDRATFHAWYEAMPPHTRAELIGGAVHMPSPVSRDHSGKNRPISTWLGLYEEATPGVWGGDNASVFLDDRTEVQPNCLLLILPECGGRTRDDEGYLAGPPELIVEISRSSRPIDLGAKKDEYERAGVPEYLVVALDPNEIRWFINQEGRFVSLEPDANGTYRSRVFPGLWLDARALFARDFRGLRATLEQGLASAEHAAFVAALAARRGQR
jgi:Uma2 family endonuclease